jgi:hypothetical protein
MISANAHLQSSQMIIHISFLLLFNFQLLKILHNSAQFQLKDLDILFNGTLLLNVN